MMNGIFSWLLATFVLGPFQVELAAQLERAKAPPAVIQQVQTCVATAAPILIDRAASNWWWGATTVTGVAVGVTDPRVVLMENAPACGPAMDAVKQALGSVVSQFEFQGASESQTAAIKQHAFSISAMRRAVASGA